MTMIRMDILPVHPAPFVDESASGYLRRVASRNGYESAGDLVSSMGIKKSTRVAWRPERTVDDKGVMILTAQPGHQDQYLLSHNARCCPQCLLAYGYWREIWENALVPFCIEHESLLLAQCVHCGKAFNKSDVSLMHCACGADLRVQPTRSITINESMLALAELLLNSINSHVLIQPLGFPGEIAALSKAALNKVVQFFGAYSQFNSSRMPRKLSIKTNPDIAMAVVSAAAEVCEKWPAGLHKLLEPHLAENLPTRSLRHRLGYLYTAIHRDFALPEFGFLRKAFDQLMVDKWPDLIDLKGRWLDSDVREQQHYVSATALSKKTGVSKSQLRRWIESEKVIGTVNHMASGRVQVAVRKDQEPEILRLKNRFNLKEAAIYIGLPERRLRELLVSDVVYGQQFDSRAQWQIHLSELERFISKIKNSASPYCVSRNMFSLDQILRCRWLPEWDFVDLMNAIGSGSIITSWMPSRHKHNFKSLRVDVLSLNGWADKADTGLSIRAVCDLLKIKQEVGYHLVNHNILVARDAGRLGRRIDLHELNEFNQRYCFARDLAKTHKTSSRAVMERLSSEGVFPISGPAMDGCRQALYARVEVAAAGFE